MKTTSWICDNCGCTLPMQEVTIFGVKYKGPTRSKLHNSYLQPLNRDIDLCSACACKIDEDFTKFQLEAVAEATAIVARSKCK